MTPAIPPGPFSVVLKWCGAELRVRGRRQNGVIDLEVFEIVDAVSGAPLEPAAVGALCALGAFLNAIMDAIVTEARR
jgi:hypothetical protein